MSISVNARHSLQKGQALDVHARSYEVGMGERGLDKGAINVCLSLRPFSPSPLRHMMDKVEGSLKHTQG